MSIFLFIRKQEYTGEDDSELYLEERETALRLAQEEKRRQQMAVPGILNPHEMPEEMQDWIIHSPYLSFSARHSSLNEEHC